MRGHHVLENGDITTIHTNDAPISVSGPTINGTPSTVQLLSPEQLGAYPYLPELLSLINESFRATHQIDNLFPPDINRLDDVESLLKEFNPKYFTYVISSSEDPQRLFATATGQPYVPPKPDSNDDWRPKMDAINDLLRQGASLWELKLICVDASVHRQGLASMLMVLVENEIKRRAQAGQIPETSIPQNVLHQDKASTETNVKPKDIRLSLTTANEINGPFYTKRGYKVIDEKIFPKGTIRNGKDFLLVAMEKNLAVP